ncbi:MAG: TIGR04104 family putative zinc finger protein [Clostridiaceae bacterium]
MKNICKNCNEPFKYTDIFKSFVKGSKLKCKKCSKEYKLLWYYKLLYAVLVSIPIFFLNKLIELLGFYILLVYIVWLLIIFLVCPLFFVYKEI